MRLAGLLVALLTFTAGCLAPTPPAADTDAPAEAPSKVLLPGAVIRTDYGDITLALYPERMPTTVANFEGLVRDGFYNSTLFDRVVDNFVIQGGDGGPLADKDPIPLETHPELFFASGTLGMARGLQEDSATTVFFIDEYPQPHLHDPRPGVSEVYGEFAAFGQVVDGMSVVRAIASVPVLPTDRPVEDVPMTVELTTVEVPADVAAALPLKVWGREVVGDYRVSLESAGTLHAGGPAPYLAWFVESNQDRTADTGLTATMRIEGPAGSAEVPLARHAEDGNIHLAQYAFPLEGEYELTLIADGRELVTFPVRVE